MEKDEILRRRTRRLNKARLKTKGRDFVLCWLQQALRSHDNPTIDAAIALGNKHGLPVVVYHGLGARYPHASLRLHKFILEASQSLEKDVESRGLRFCRYVERAEKPEKGLVYRLAERAAAIVSDDVPVFVGRFQAERVAPKIDVPFLLTDALALVPQNLFPRLIATTKGFRAAHTPLRKDYLETDTTLSAEVSRFDGELGFEPDEIGDFSSDELESLIAKCNVDMTLPAAQGFTGHRSEALERLRFAVEKVVPNYNFRRTNPADELSASRLSPFLHFGVLSPREVALAVLDSAAHSAAKWKFNDEFLTWREWFHHLARFWEKPDAYENVPQWGRETLAAHAFDPRPQIYSLSELVHGETDDETWNAAQRQYLVEGYMHNNLRMYWGKQIIKWTETPEKAWETACYLNDRLSLDGRDAATYGNIQWCFGRAKPAWKETLVYGKVTPKADSALRKRKGVNEWLNQMANRPIPRIAVP